MNKKTFTFAGLCAASCFVLGLHSFATTKTNLIQQTKPKEQRMTKHASGTFEVKLAPQQDENAQEANLGRMTINKQFHGDLEANSKGQMLAAMTEIKGSAGYVAIERVTGTLHGQKGSFVLQHNGIMNRNVPELSVIVVPDSGTDELKGLTGKMTIKIAEGKHFYEFEYSFATNQ